MGLTQDDRGREGSQLMTNKGSDLYLTPC